MNCSFKRTTFKELETRIGEQKDRISSIRKLSTFIGQRVYIVSNPSEVEEDSLKLYSNSFVNYWNLSDLYDIRGNKITDLKRYKEYLHDGIFSVDLTRHKTRFEKLAKPVINILDYNVIPNKYSNNAMFSTESAAKGFQFWLKMKYEGDKVISALPDNVFTGSYVVWEDFLNNKNEFWSI